MARYEKQVWLDHIVDEKTGEIIQQGTVHSQERMNHIEEGIYQSADIELVDIINEQAEQNKKDLLLKPDKTYVDSELKKKADKSYVDNELSEIKGNTIPLSVMSEGTLVTKTSTYASTVSVTGKGVLIQLDTSLSSGTLIKDVYVDGTKIANLHTNTGEYKDSGIMPTFIPFSKSFRASPDVSSSSSSKVYFVFILL